MAIIGMTTCLAKECLAGLTLVALKSSRSPAAQTDAVGGPLSCLRLGFLQNAEPKDSSV